MRCFLNLRDGVHYRREAFTAGFESLGFQVIHGLPTKPRRGDVLCIWNRYRDNARAADRFEQDGLPVLIAENGYLGNEFAGSRWYAVARNQHNGAGTWPKGGHARWNALNVPLLPYRTGGGDVVVLPQRGIGPPGVAMPGHWLESVKARLRSMGVGYRVRHHPGIKPASDLTDDLHGASAVVTWGSGAALKALALGVPAFADFPAWIGAQAAFPVTALGDGAFNRDDAARLDMFRRLAWAQWRLDEIADGSAFRALLGEAV